MPTSTPLLLEPDSTPATGVGGTNCARRDRRKSPRRAWICQAYVGSPTRNFRLPGHPYDRHAVTAVNLSEEGIAFTSDQPLPVGSFQRMEIEGESARPREVYIRRCEQAGETYEVGAEFR